MPSFVMIGHDKPGALPLRKQHRADHLQALAALETAGRLRHAGPLLDADGAPCGSCVVFDAASLTEATALAAADVYVVHGVFERHTVHETVCVFPSAPPASTG